MAPKNLTKKKLQTKNKKPAKKAVKIVSKPVDDDDDSDGSLDAIEFNSE